MSANYWPRWVEVATMADLYVPDVTGMDTLTAALAYADAGWFVLPVRPDAKNPGSVLRKGWQHQTSRDPQQITAWFTGTSYALALHTGRSGAVAFDIDAPENTPDILRAMAAAHRPAFQSTRTNDADRGHHVYAAEPMRYGCSVGDLGNGWGEVRAGNSVIVVEPSTHSKENGRYRWLRGGVLPPLPAELGVMLRPPGGSSAAVTSPEAEAFLTGLPAGPACPVVDRVNVELPEQGRHQAILSATLTLVRHGEQGHHGAVEVLEALRDAFVSAVEGDRAGGAAEAEREYDRALSGAIGNALASPTAESDRRCCGGRDEVEAWAKLGIDITRAATFDPGNGEVDGDAGGRPINAGAIARRAHQDRPEVHIGSPVVAVEFLRETIGTGPLAGFFLRDDQLVHTPAEGEDGYVKLTDRKRDDDGPAQVRPVTSGQVRARVQATYRVVREQVKEDEHGNQIKERTSTLFPREAAPFITDAPDTAPNLRRLRGVTHTPLVRADGSILGRPGYDEATGLLFLPDAGLEVPAVPEHPAPGVVKAAVGLLDEATEGFPFISDHDRANYYGALLTPLLRELVGPPYKLVVFWAHQPGSGKSLLARVLRILHGGVFRSAAPTTEEEWHKALSTILNVTTAPVVTLDNVTGTLKSGTLDGLLTSARWGARQLGRTDDQIDRANDRLWTVTSNNASIGGDLVRRTMWVGIDPAVPHPELRTGFAITDLPAWVRARRGDLLAALLTLVRAWVMAGRPSVATRSDDYARWSSVVAGILSVAGVPGAFDHPDSARQEVSEDDEELATFLAAADQVFPGDRWTVRELLDRAWPVAGVGTANRFPEDALPGPVAERPTGQARATTLGKWLGFREGRWAGGRCLRRHKRDTSDNTTRWEICRLSTGLPQNVGPEVPEVPETFRRIESETGGRNDLDRAVPTPLPAPGTGNHSGTSGTSGDQLVATDSDGLAGRPAGSPPPLAGRLPTGRLPMPHRPGCSCPDLSQPCGVARMQHSGRT